MGKLLNKIFFCIGAGFCLGLLFLFPRTILAAEINQENIYSAINLERDLQELRPLILNGTLNHVADLRANDMVINDYFAHQSPTGLLPWDIALGENYDYKILGENLALDYVDTQTVVNDWMASTDHRNNILNPQYSETGLAVTDKNGSWLIVQIFAQPKYQNTLTPAHFVDENDRSVDSIIPNNQKSEKLTVLGTYNVQKQQNEQINYINMYNLWIFLLTSGFFLFSMSLFLIPEKN